MTYCVKQSASFAAVWVLFLLLIASIGGTIVLKKYHTPLAIGIFLGASAMMSQLMFVLFVVFISLAKTAEGAARSGNRAMSFFSFVLFVCFGAFSVVLAKYRTTIMVASEGEEPEKVEEVGGWQPEPVSPTGAAV
ncbi:unnamed protein product [Chrysoparadoxa australica]